MTTDAAQEAARAAHAARMKRYETRELEAEKLPDTLPFLEPAGAVVLGHAARGIGALIARMVHDLDEDDAQLFTWLIGNALAEELREYTGHGSALLGVGASVFITEGAMAYQKELMEAAEQSEGVTQQ